MSNRFKPGDRVVISDRSPFTTGRGLAGVVVVYRDRDPWSVLVLLDRLDEPRLWACWENELDPESPFKIDFSRIENTLEDLIDVRAYAKRRADSARAVLVTFPYMPRTEIVDVPGPDGAE